MEVQVNENSENPNGVTEDNQVEVDHEENKSSKPVPENTKENQEQRKIQIKQIC